METTFCTHKGYDTVAPCGKDCPTNQPIEEKWKGGWQWRSDRMGLDKDQHDEIFDFIENLLEQERRRMSEEIYQARKSNTTDSAGDVWEKVLSIINK